jgi:hypothetical protein
VDQLFALVKAYLKAKLSWEVPEEVSHYLHQRLSPAVQQKGEVMRAASTRRAFAHSVTGSSLCRSSGSLATLPLGPPLVRVLMLKFIGPSSLE